ncbi:hypothetical protein PHSC3_001977 [Chlamydiales bacterium STE3]|nr:hypothetical protein PHSC3_001977 [Chlamydiales bacterium STE3]
MGKRILSDIGSKTKGLLGGVKEKWASNNEAEKRYLMSAATILAIVMLVFALLSFVFGFGAAAMGILIQGLAPIAFTATIPMLMYARSKHNRSPKMTQQEIESVRKQGELIQKTREANKQRLTADEKRKEEA